MMSRLKRLVPRQVRIARIQVLAAVRPRKVAWLKPPRNDLEISVLTAPVPEGFHYVPALLESWLRKLTGGTGDTPYGGHPAVTRSVVEGLRKIGVRGNYNPADVRELSQTVLVLSSVRALRQMIKLKQQGYLRRLLVGPDILDDPGSHDAILASPEIDRYLVRAPWVGLVARMLPTLGERCEAWASGVDTELWAPVTDTPRTRVLIYDKQIAGPTPSVGPYRAELETRGYDVRVIEYGAYTPNEYRSALQSARLMVAFSRSETQGLALAEAWSCDVPTLVWRNSEPTYLGVAYGGSTAPYMTDATGKLFADIGEFRSLLDRWERGELRFEARRWCRENMSDETCARSLMAIVQKCLAC